jgi:hypothetical protein
MVHNMNGIPEILVTDQSGEQTGAKWVQEMNIFRIRRFLTEPYLHWQNLSEREIGIIKAWIKRWTRRRRSPKRLWDYCGQLAAAIRRLMAHNYAYLDGKTPYECIHARTLDISSYT